MNRRRAALLGLALLAVVGLGARIRILRDWTFYGSDSYGYIQLAQELSAEHRFALGHDQPLHWYRRPLYPMFIAAVAVDETPSKPIHHPRLQWAQSLIDVFVTSILILLCARKLGGWATALVAFGLAMICPFTVPYTSAALTESLAMCLTMAAIAPLVLGAERPMRWFPVAAVAVALSALLRPDGIVLGLAFIPAILLLPGDVDRKRQLQLAGVSLAVFFVVFAPWPIRNLIDFGRPHLADGMVDRTTHDVPNYKGFWDWLRSFATDSKPFEFPQSCFYDRKCMPTILTFEPFGAFDSDDERRTVARLLAMRTHDGFTPEVNDGFARLAAERRARHPLSTVWLPLRRMVAAWIGPQDELLLNPSWRPWKSLSTRLLPFYPKMQLLLLIAAALGAGFLVGRARTRAAGVIVLTALGVRTVVLGWSGFCLPRYLQPIYGLVLLLAAVGAVESIRELRRRVLRSRS
jgi:hypothetical protein